MRSGLIEQREATPVFGDAPHVHDGVTHPTGFYAVFRCPKCTDIHLSIRARPIEVAGRPPLMQLAMNSAEARELAAQLLAFAEGH